ncbi:MAG TPA: ferredoxin [Verrucomicrobia bacterium]|nr:MAG: ferredoxin [Lentisphaerae bacterium GWF2_57_35]HBA85321.1 ferredoxin [Verrucomicrobiota bacterium]
MNQSACPFVCHVFVCTNDRKGERKSCADGQAKALKELLKDAVAKRGWKTRVRVSQSGCLGLCQQGPNVVIYPQGLWFSGVTHDDHPSILFALEKILAGS